MSTDSKVAVITGASQGIGEGLVRGFLARGYRVVANSRSIKPDAYEGDVLAVAGDITDPAVAERVVGGAVEKFGRVDTLVNNAGMFISKPFTEYTEADFARVVSLNLAGFFHVTQRAIRQMLAQGRRARREPDDDARGPAREGRAVGPGVPHQGRARRRHAVAGDRVRGQGHPGERGGAGHHQDADARRPRRSPSSPRLHPLGRMGEVPEIVEAVLYLESAGFVTGETLHVDGGAHAGHW